jgi:hypothetical protein
MKAAFTKAIISLALIGVGSAAGSASALERNIDRGGKHYERFEQRGWERHDRDHKWGWGKYSQERPYYRHDRYELDRGHDNHRHGDKDGVTIILRSLFN